MHLNEIRGNKFLVPVWLHSGRFSEDCIDWFLQWEPLPSYLNPLFARCDRYFETLDWWWWSWLKQKQWTVDLDHEILNRQTCVLCSACVHACRHAWINACTAVRMWAYFYLRFEYFVWSANRCFKVHSFMKLFIGWLTFRRLCFGCGELILA